MHCNNSLTQCEPPADWQKDIRLVGITSVHVNLGLWLVNLAVLVYLPLTQKGKPVIESERKQLLL